MGRKTIAIIGDGGWGTALALHLNGLGHRVIVWSYSPEYSQVLSTKRENKRFLPGFKLPTRISFTADIKEAVLPSELVILAIPTPFIRGVLPQMQRMPLKGKLFVNVAKGIENDSLLLPTQIIRLGLKNIPLAVLSGPSHAEEVARKMPTCVVIAHPDKDVRERLQRVFISKHFRVYTSRDVLGVQIGGAVKNVVAIAGGICDGLKYGDNTKAALLSRGVSEIVRLGVRMGAKRETFYGLSGLGDLVTTCISPYGRNRAVGESLGRGKNIKTILANMQMVAEGVKTAQSVHDLSTKFHIEMPICEEVYKVIYQNKSPQKALFDLMLRAPREER